MARARPAQRAARTSAIEFGRRIGQDLKRQRLQCVAGENCRCFAEGAMGRRAPAPQVVVVHRREIVVNQRVRVNAFDRRAGAAGALVLASERPRRFNGEEGPEPFAAAERRIAHRFDKALRPSRLAKSRFGLEQNVELPLDCGPGFGELGRKGGVVHDPRRP